MHGLLFQPRLVAAATIKLHILGFHHNNKNAGNFLSSVEICWTQWTLHWTNAPKRPKEGDECPCPGFGLATMSTVRSNTVLLGLRRSHGTAIITGK